MSQKYNAPRGTQDVLPPDSTIHQFITDTARKIFNLYGYKEIQTPVFEHTELFVRGVGESTDLVSKEMYTFLDKKGRSLSLRPEGTAGVIRSYLEHNLGAQNPINKLYYVGPMFRYERPQAGRLRQHTQIGAECIGSGNPLIDAEIIAMFRSFIINLGLDSYSLLINSLGHNSDDCRMKYKNALKDYFLNNLSQLCQDCKERFQLNPLRILDCKNESCRPIIKKAPNVLENICGDCSNHFTFVKGVLDALHIYYRVDPYLVRGLDYYTRTLFEFQVSTLGAQNAIGGGGRYDNLVEELGGRTTPALGFGAGIERIALALKSQNVQVPLATAKPSITLIAQGQSTFSQALLIAEELRKSGIPVGLDYQFLSIKSQLRFANKLGSPYVLILGENELGKDVILLKTMSTGEQKEIPLAEIPGTLISLFS